MTHAGIIANLRENLRVDADGHHLRSAGTGCRWSVEDAPFVVVRVEREGDALAVTLIDGSRERLDPATLTLRGEVPYARVKDGRFAARFSRAAAWQLWQLADYDEARDAATLTLAGRRHPIPPA